MTTWVKVFNSMPCHGKFLLAGDRAGWLFVCGLCYSNEHLTDGFVARYALPAVAPGVRNPEAQAARLVTAGLWHEVEDGWRIHDYQEHQRSAGEIRDRRSKDIERKAATRSARTPSGQTADSAQNGSGIQADPRARDRGRSQEVEGRRQKADRTTSEISLLCHRLADHIVSNDPKADPKPDSERWLTDMRLLVEDRTGDVAEVRWVIDWCQADAFWRSNILSPAKLRKQFTQLLLKAKGGDVVQLRRSPDGNASDWLNAMDAAADVIDVQVIEDEGAA